MGWTRSLALSAFARAALGCCVLGLACGSDEPPTGRVLLVAIDGASWQVIDPLLEAGRLPHLAGIAAAGLYGSIRSFPKLRSPRIWTTVATGKTPEKHGIKGWVKPAGVGRIALYYSHDRQGHALWNIASAAGLRVSIVNWLVTYPPEIVRGVLVSDHTFPQEIGGKLWIAGRVADHFGVDLEPVARGPDRGPVVSPPEWRERVLAESHRETALTNFAEPIASQAALGRFAYLSRHFHRDQQLTSIALEIDAAIHPDLTMILLQGVDRLSHYLWAGIEPPQAYREPPLDAAEHAAAREALESYYAYTDALIGRLLEGYAPDDLVLVISDHGFEADEEEALVTGNHHSPDTELGVIFARGRGIESGAEVGGVTVRDITPTILAWWGLPLARDMDGRVAGFLDVDRPRSIASYDGEPIRRLTIADSGAEDAILEELRALGYVE